MKIYFSAAISAGRIYAPIYKKMVETLQDNQFDILTEHVADPNVLHMEKSFSATEVYNRDIRLIHDCDLLLAEVSHPSTGVGYEIAYALLNDKPVIAAYLSGLKVSKMITGNTQSNLYIYTYESINDLLDYLPGWIETSISVYK